MAYALGTPYIVQASTTLSIIAEHRLGNGNRWTEIKNPDSTSPNSNGLQPGQKLYLSASSTDLMAREITAAHNKYRAEVGVPPLKWSNDLLTWQSKRMQKLGENC